MGFTLSAIPENMSISQQLSEDSRKSVCMKDFMISMFRTIPLFGDESFPGLSSALKVGEPSSNTDNFTSDDSKDLAKYFAFPHGSFAFNLSGLSPGSSNTMYIYTVGFETNGIRECKFSSSYGGAITNIDQNTVCFEISEP